MLFKCSEFSDITCKHQTQLGNVAVFENRQPGTEAKFINKSS